MVIPYYHVTMIASIRACSLLVLVLSIATWSLAHIPTTDQFTVIYLAPEITSVEQWLMTARAFQSQISGHYATVDAPVAQRAETAVRPVSADCSQTETTPVTQAAAIPHLQQPGLARTIFDIIPEQSLANTSPTLLVPYPPPRETLSIA